MKIEQKQEGSKGAFFVGDENQRKAEMTFSMADDSKMIIDHTEVSDELRGQNVGKQLVNAAVEYAREKQIKILPLCPFARSVFDKTSDYHDVLFKHV